MGSLLTDADETVHSIGTQPNWNESRYIDFWDAKQRVGGWFRVGNRPNEGRAEMSACIKVSAAGSEREHAIDCNSAALNFNFVLGRPIGMAVSPT